MPEGELEQRKGVKEYRAGQAQRFLDAVHALVEITNAKGFITFDKEDNAHYDSQSIEDIIKILYELRRWDIGKVGDLYLTSGGRVVLDKGYGEYFTEGDTKLFAREELHSGIRFDEFMKRLKAIYIE